MSTEDDSTTVLVVAERAAAVDLVEEALPDCHDVRGVPAPASLPDPVARAVDVVVLDALPGGTTVAELLDAVRDRGVDGPVVALRSDPDGPDVDVGASLVGSPDPADVAEAVEECRRDARSGDATVFDALGDEKARRCCRALLEEPRTARELADATGYSLPTVYRRLDALKDAGLVEARTRIRDGGGNYEVYRTVAMAVRIDLEDGFRVDLDRDVNGSRA